MQAGDVSRDGARGPVAIVTGAGSGIGRATALRLATDGYRVTLAGRRDGALRETADLMSGPCVVAVCDVADAAAVKAMVSTTAQTFGRIDVVVNNAGISRSGDFSEVTIDGWREVMATDVESVLLVTQAALPFLVERKGSVVNVASVAGLGGDPGMTIYNAAKGAVVNLTRSLAVELAARGVRVNAVAPSLTATAATADIPEGDVAEFLRRIPMGRAAEPAEIADVIAFLAGHDAPSSQGWSYASATLPSWSQERHSSPLRSRCMKLPTRNCPRPLGTDTETACFVTPGQAAGGDNPPDNSPTFARRRPADSPLSTSLRGCAPRRSRASPWGQPSRAKASSSDHV